MLSEKCSGRPRGAQSDAAAEVRGKPACALLECGNIERPSRQRPIRAGEQEDLVGLPHAEMRPGAVGRVAAIEHDIVRGFERIEPFRGAVGAGRVEHCGSRAHVDQRRDQALRDCFVLQTLLHRDDRKGPRAGSVRRPPHTFVQTAYQDAHEIENHVWMALDQRLKTFAADAEKLGVAHGDELRGVRLAGDQRHLAHRFARGHVCDQPPLSLVVFREDAERSGDDEEERAIVVPVSRQEHAARQAEPDGLAEQTLDCRFAHILKQREGAQPLAKRIGISRFPACPEGRKNVHGHGVLAHGALGVAGRQDSMPQGATLAQIPENIVDWKGRPGAVR